MWQKCHAMIHWIDCSCRKLRTSVLHDCIVQDAAQNAGTLCYRNTMHASSRALRYDCAARKMQELDAMSTGFYCAWNTRHKTDLLLLLPKANEKMNKSKRVDGEPQLFQVVRWASYCIVKVPSQVNRHGMNASKAVLLIIFEHCPVLKSCSHDRSEKYYTHVCRKYSENFQQKQSISSSPNLVNDSRFSFKVAG